MRKRIFDIIWITVCLVALNISITSFIYSVKNPDKTQMQVFLHIPYHYGWDFK